MTRVVSYSRDKKDLASENRASLKHIFYDEDVEEMKGITVKSIKATRPKNGHTQVTIKFKGSNKYENKAVKAINKQFKKIKVQVMGSPSK